MLNKDTDYPLKTLKHLRFYQMNLNCYIINPFATGASDMELLSRNDALLKSTVLWRQAIPDVKSNFVKKKKKSLNF